MYLDMTIPGTVDQQVSECIMSMELVTRMAIGQKGRERKHACWLTPCHVGFPGEKNVHADIEAAFHYLRDVIGLSPHQIVLYGRSLGSGPSCYLAHKSAQDGRSVGGLILHSPFLSVFRVVVNLGFTVSGDKFPNVDRLSNVE